MANETIYSPGSKSFRDVAMSDIMKNFPELTTKGHFDFNKFLADHPELQGRSDIYNILGGMNVADVIEPGSTWWSGNKGLSTMGGLYSLWDTMTHPEQDLLGESGGFSDWMRYMKGIGIQRDWNPYGLLYDEDEDEADYYKGYYKKMQKDFQRSEIMKDLFQKRRNIPGTPIVPVGDVSAAPAGGVTNIVATGDGGGGFSPQLDPGSPGSAPSWRGATAAREAAGKSVAGPGFGRGAYWAKGGLIDKPLPGRSRYI